MQPRSLSGWQKVPDFVELKYFTGMIICDREESSFLRPRLSFLLALRIGSTELTTVPTLYNECSLRVNRESRIGENQGDGKQ